VPIAAVVEVVGLEVVESVYVGTAGAAGGLKG